MASMVESTSGVNASGATTPLTLAANSTPNTLVSRGPTTTPPHHRRPPRGGGGSVTGLREFVGWLCRLRPDCLFRAHQNPRDRAFEEVGSRKLPVGLPRREPGPEEQEVALLLHLFMLGFLGGHARDVTCVAQRNDYFGWAKRESSRTTAGGASQLGPVQCGGRPWVKARPAHSGRGRAGGQGEHLLARTRRLR